MKTNKRIKRVFSSSKEVLHLWAAQSQDSARQAGSGGNVGPFGSVGWSGYSRCYFEGTSAYSYGYHYKLGELVKINGKRVALINTTGASVTTSGHISDARRATSHMLQIEVDGSFDWQRGLLKMQGSAIDGVMDLLNRRSMYEYALKGALKSVTEFNALAKALGRNDLKIVFSDDLIETVHAHVKKRAWRTMELNEIKRTKNAAAYEARLEEIKRDLAERAAAAPAEIEAWKMGGEFTSNVYDVFPQLLRIKDGNIETSSHATVSLADARTAMRLLATGKLKKGDKIGDYEFEKVKGDRVIIGCHAISLKQAKAILGGHLSLVKETA